MKNGMMSMAVSINSDKILISGISVEILNLPDCLITFLVILFSRPKPNF